MDDSVVLQQWPAVSLERLNTELLASMLSEAESPQAWPNQTPLNQQQLKTATSTAENCMLLNASTCFSSLNYLTSQSSFGNQNMALEPMRSVKPNTRQAQANSHILAERKRREKLTQKFIALSSLIPGLKKIDKASVLGDAIKYMKQLQERTKILEEQTKKKPMESAIFVRKYVVFSDKESDCSETTEQLPKIEARFCDNDVLIVIHCLKMKGIVEKTVVEIEKLHLSVVNSYAMSFGDSALNITISAQKDEGFSMNVKELMKNLRGALDKIFK